MTELLRRVAGVVILDASEDVSGIAAALELPRTSPGQPKDGSLVALAWVEPTTQDFVRLAEARWWLAPWGEDGTFKLASRHVGPQVKVLRQAPGEGKQRALARAFDETRGEVIFFTDADCLLADETFERTI